MVVAEKADFVGYLTVYMKFLYLQYSLYAYFGFSALRATEEPPSSRTHFCRKYTFKTPQEGVVFPENGKPHPL